MKTKCTLTDEELIEKCDEWIYNLRKSAGQAWILHVPADPDNDPDMVFSELIDRFKETL